MKLSHLSLCTLLVLSPFVANAVDKDRVFYPHTNIPNIDLSEEEELACEALLCLSSPTRPSECARSLKKYYSIRAKKWHKTVAKRKSFLKLCPKSEGINIDKIASQHTPCDKSYKCTDAESPAQRFEGLEDTKTKLQSGSSTKLQSGGKTTLQSGGKTTLQSGSKTTLQANSKYFNKGDQSKQQAVSHAGWSDGSQAVTGGGGLVLDSKSLYWAGSKMLLPSTNYTISFSRLGSPIREVAHFTTSELGQFGLHLADTAFDLSKPVTLTDEYGDVVYQLNPRNASSDDNRSVKEIKLGRFYQLHNTPISEKDKLIEDKSGTYWIH